MTKASVKVYVYGWVEEKGIYEYIIYIKLIKYFKLQYILLFISEFWRKYFSNIFVQAINFLIN